MRRASFSPAGRSLPAKILDNTRIICYNYLVEKKKRGTSAMKELERIILKINSFIAPFGLTCCVGGDFCYYYLDNEIQVSFLSIEKDEEDFMRSVERLNPLVSMDVFMWSLLHEIGHSETLNELLDCEWEKSTQIKKLCREGKLSSENYYNCIDEVLATQWAVDYANENSVTLSEFWNELQPLILDFYNSL